MTADHSLDETAGTGIDTSVPHSARIWNYWLGGKDNYEVDRAAGDQFSAIYPGIVDIARADRAFLGPGRPLPGRRGRVRQFLDVGTGLPTADNTHEVAQRVAPDSRVVYVDNDPLVLVHARALLTSSPEGSTHYVAANMGDPEMVLREAAKWLDLAQPVGLTFMGVLGHVTDHAEARSIVAGLVDGLAAGSYLAINDSINTSEALEAALRAIRGIRRRPVPDPQPGGVHRLLRRPGTGGAGRGPGGGLAPRSPCPTRPGDPAGRRRRAEALTDARPGPADPGRAWPGSHQPSRQPRRTGSGCGPHH